jgi:MoxR-like ATPase
MDKEAFYNALIDAELDDVIGQDEVKRQLKSALLADRHIILVGEPGIGKTTLAKNVAKLLPGDETFIRVQGSPDLTSEDLIGDIDPAKAMEHGPMSLEAFTKGKIFQADNGVLFFDEVNRCSDKLQNALLQALEEQQVTVGSYTVDFDVDFVFIGTMNPDDTSTEPLSDVFLDRFDMIYMHHPDEAATEIEIVRSSGKHIVDFPDELLDGVVAFIRSLRDDENVEKVPSVRASIGVYERAQAHARLHDRDTVTLDDVSDVIVSVVAHRMSLKPSMKYVESVERYVEQQYHDFTQAYQKGEYL